MKMSTTTRRVLVYALGLAIGMLFVHMISSRKAAMMNLHVPEKYARTNVHQALARQPQWYNLSRPIVADELRGRVILLDFWTYCCINCMHVIPDLQTLEKEFGDKLTVIGVHSGKFQNEKDGDNIRNAIMRYGIEHPVVNDPDYKLWGMFDVHAWPTFVLIGPEGRVLKRYSGEGHREALRADISALLQQYPDATSQPLPVVLESAALAPSALRFPAKIIALSDRKLLAVTDAGHQHVVLMTPDGKITERIDGGELPFLKPQGLAYDAQAQRLYVADTGNHLLRAIDLKSKKVSTLAGTGRQGHMRAPQQAPALTTPLASPWDVALIDGGTQVLIAMAGTHQLWSYDVHARTVSVVAGNGAESIDDGRYPDNSLSQPSGLAVGDDGVYVVDAETSSLRVLARDGSLHTLIGTGLFDFGFRDGRGKAAQLQHPLGVAFAEGKVFIADSYNHAVRVYDPNTQQLSTLAGDGAAGFSDGRGKAAHFSEPGGLAWLDGKLYIADTNNHRVRVVDVSTGTVKTAERL